MFHKVPLAKKGLALPDKNENREKGAWGPGDRGITISAACGIEKKWGVSPRRLLNNLVAVQGFEPRTLRI